MRCEGLGNSILGLGFVDFWRKLRFAVLKTFTNYVDRVHLHKAKYPSVQRIPRIF